MKEKLNYPIKYALLEMKEAVGWANSGDYEIAAYVVSKVYVIKETKKYSFSGESKIYYQVVFPFKEINDLKTRGGIPYYNCYGECLNETKVSQLFDTFEEAKNVANGLNDNLRVQSTMIIFSDKNWKEKYVKDLEKFDVRLAEYEQFEQQLILLQENMQISEEPVLLHQTISR